MNTWYEPRSEMVEKVLMNWSASTFSEELETSAEVLTGYLHEQGFDDVGIIRAASDIAPAVLARSPTVDGAPNVLLVGLHDGPWLDGGSPDNIANDERGLVGPGVAGRFAPILAHTEAYLGLQHELEGAPPVNLAVLAIDSASLGTNQLEAILRAANFDGIDVIVSTPAVAWDLKAPTVSLGARGELLVEIIAGTGRDLQINTFGGAVRNPLATLVQVLSELRDPAGRIALPGFYTRAVPPTVAERDALRRGGYDPARWLHGTGSSVLSGGPAPLERASAWPTVEITSINSGADHRLRGQTIAGAAAATVSFGLVNGQRPQEIEASLRNWLDTRRAAGVQLTMNVIASSAPYQVQRDTPWVIGQARAAKRVFNRAPIPVLGGGTPGMSEIATRLAAPMLFSGITSPASFVDTENERLSRERLQLGVNLAAELFTQLGKRAARVRTQH